MNVALDTNVLAYAEGLNDDAKRGVAVDLLERLAPESTLLPVQVLGELFHVLVGKARRSKAAASDAVLSWGDAFPLIESTGDVLLAATDLTRTHTFGLWDALILSAAADARCRLLLSEDLQSGFTWRGVTVVNPFAADRHPLLDALVSGSDGPRTRSRRAARPT